MTATRNADVLVVGGGPAGVIAALTAARRGCDVILLDSKRRQAIGDKTCGDGLSRSAAEFLRDDLQIELLPEEIDAKPDTVAFVARGVETTFRNELLIIDRPAFGQRLLKLAEEAGVTLLEQHKATRALLDGGAVTGARIKDRSQSTSLDVRAAVTVDCSGKACCLRRTLSQDTFPLIDTAVPKTGFAVTYREIIEFDGQHDIPLDAIKVFYEAGVPSPGYFWVFPKGRHRLNVGIGWPHGWRSAGDLRAEYRRLFRRHLDSAKYRVVDGRGDLLPFCYPLTNGVAGGFIVAGDAAFHTNPLTGEGHGPALMAGYHAGVAAADAVADKEPTGERLWQYNAALAAMFISDHAADSLLAEQIRSMGSGNWSFLLARGVVDQQIMSAAEQTPARPWSTLRRLLALAPRYHLLLPLLRVARGSARLADHFAAYPTTPSLYPAWKQGLDQLLRIRDIEQRG